MIDITVIKGYKTKMISSVSQEITKALSTINPPFDDARDIVRLRKYAIESDRIKLTYEILRGVRSTKAEQNRSPYREKGFVMNVGRNS